MANQLAANTGIDLGLPEHADKPAGIKMGCSLVDAAVVANVIISSAKRYKPVAQLIGDLDPAMGAWQQWGYRDSSTGQDRPEYSQQGHNGPQNMPHLRFR